MLQLHASTIRGFCMATLCLLGTPQVTEVSNPFLTPRFAPDHYTYDSAHSGNLSCVIKLVSLP